MLKAEHIHITYYRTILDDATMKACHGQLTGLIGESGSGKSSLLNRLSLYAYDYDFDYELDGLNIRQLSSKETEDLLKSKIAYLRQECTFMENMRIEDNLRMEAWIAGGKITDRRIQEVLEEVDLVGKEHLYPSSLSGGREAALGDCACHRKGSRHPAFG